MAELCKIKGCYRRQSQRGLCLVCYSKAKKKVEAGETTWEKLVELGLCDDVDDPFGDAYKKTTEESNAADDQ